MGLDDLAMTNADVSKLSNYKSVFGESSRYHILNIIYIYIIIVIYILLCFTVVYHVSVLPFHKNNYVISAI